MVRNRGASARRNRRNRRERIKALEREVRALAGGNMTVGFSEDCPSAVKEAFWRRVLAFERSARAEKSCLFDEFMRNGMQLPEPEGLLYSRMLCLRVDLLIEIKYDDCNPVRRSAYSRTQKMTVYSTHSSRFCEVTR